MQGNHKSNQLKGSFQFKQFTIEPGEAGMPVSTDGVLLGAWAQLGENFHLLDIGTGTGLLALMCAQRQPDLTIEAIDIEETAIKSATRNIVSSPWKSRIQIKHSDLVAFTPRKKFDLIICNPPYFNSGETSKRESRAIARHTETLNHLSLLQHSKKLLCHHGKASFILPIDEGKLFIQHAKQEHWHLSRLCEVKPTERKPVHRLLIELSLEPSQCEYSNLTIRHGDEYSQQFIALTKEFYLKM